MAEEMEHTETPQKSADVPASFYAELGVSGLNRWGNDVYEDLLKQLQFPQAAKIYQEMSDNDPTIGAILYMCEQLIRKATWTTKPASDSEADLAAAKFLEECMHDMSTSWADLITECLSMFVYGFSFHESVYKIRKGPNQTGVHRSQYSDGRIGWSGFPIRAQTTLDGWDFDEQGYVTHFRQWASPEYKKVKIPMTKGLLFRTKVYRDNPEGRSLLRNAYRPWYFKKRIEEIEGIGVERDLAGLPLLIPDQNTDIWDKENPQARMLKIQAETLVRNVRRDKSEGLVIPYGWDFKLLSTGGTRQFDTNAIINRYDHKIAITMLADIVMMGGDKVGSFALGEAKQDLLTAALTAHIQNIANTFNKFAIPQLFSFNYFPGITGLPQILPGPIDTPDIKEVAFLLRAVGLDITRDLPLMNMVRTLVNVEKLDQEQFHEMYVKARLEEEAREAQKNGSDPADGTDPLGEGELSFDRDPVGHSMDDNMQVSV